MKNKLFNAWCKRILSLLLAFIFVFADTSPMLVSAAAESTSDTETIPQWDGNYRIHTFGNNDYTKNFYGSACPYGTCLLTQDGHFFMAFTQTTGGYSNELYNANGYQLYDQTLENGKWYEPFVGQTFKNAYFGEKNVLLIGHEGQLYRLCPTHMNFGEIEISLGEITGITESDIDDVILIGDLIKTKDNKYYTFDGETSTLTSDAVAYGSVWPALLLSASYDADDRTVTFNYEDEFEKIKYPFGSMTIPENEGDVFCIDVEKNDSWWFEIKFYIYTKEGIKYTYIPQGDASEPSTLSISQSERVPNLYVDTYAGKFIKKDGFVYGKDNQSYRYNDYNYYTDDLKIDNNGNIYGGYACTDSDDFGSYSGNLTHMCTYSSANVSFTKDELNDNVTKTFECVCGKNYEINAVDYNNIDPDGYSEYEATCISPGGIILKTPITGERLSTSGYATEAALGHACYDSNGMPNKVTVTPATCTQNGTYGYQCIRCDYIMTSPYYTTDMVPHVFNDEYSNKTGTCTNEFCGYKICSTCGEEILVDHITNGQHVESEDYIIETEATCAKDGLKYKTCSICGERLEDTVVNIKRSEHQFEITDNTATCTKAGKGNYTCTLCGIEYKNLRTEPLGHDYVSHIKTAATCGNTGIEEFVCSRCNDTYEEEIEGTIHDYDNVVEKEPTCTEKGVMKYTCKGCGNNYTEDIPALEHDYIADVKKEATADTQGLITYTCSKCGDRFDVVTAKDNGIRVYAGSKRILVNDTNNGHMYFTGPNDNNVEGQTVSLENAVDDEYGTRQMRMTVTTQESINYGNAVYYYGTPTSSYWGMNTLDEIITIDDDCAKEWVYGSSCDYLKSAYGKVDKVKETSHYFPNGIRTYVGNGTVDVSSGTNYLLFIDKDGRFYTVNRYFHSCDGVGGKNENMMRSARLWNYEGIKFEEVSSMETTAAGLLTDGRIAVINTYFVEEDVNLYEYKKSKSNGLDVGLDSDEWHQPKLSITGGNVRFIAESAGTFGIYGIDTAGHLRHINNDGSYSDPLNDTIYTKVSSGKDHCLALDVNGNIWAFGENKWNQCGNGDTTDISEPEKITSGVYFTDISAGYQISAAIDAAKNYYAWGHNNYSQCGVLKDGVNTITVPTVMFNVDHVHYYNRDSYTLLSTSTCEQEGVVKRVCVECGNVEEIHTSAREHDYIEPFRQYIHYVDYKKDVTDEPIYSWQPAEGYSYDLYVTEPDVYTVAVEDKDTVHIIAFSKNNQPVFKFDNNGSINTNYEVKSIGGVIQNNDDRSFYNFFNSVYYSRFSHSSLGEYNCDLVIPYSEDSTEEISKTYKDNVNYKGLPSRTICTDGGTTISITKPDVYTVAVKYNTGIYLVAFSLTEEGVMMYNNSGSVLSSTPVSNLFTDENDADKLRFFDGVYGTLCGCSSNGNVVCNLTVTVDAVTKNPTLIALDAIYDNINSGKNNEADSPEVKAAKAIWQQAEAEMVQDCSVEHQVRKICKYCYEPTYVTVPAGQHTVSKVGDKTSNFGYTRWYCSVCGELIKEETNAYSIRMTLKGTQYDNTYSWQYFSKPEQFSTSLAVDEEFTFPDEGSNSGEFIVDLGPFRTADGKNTIVGKNVVGHYGTGSQIYYPGDVVTNLTKNENFTLEMPVIYRTEIEFPDTLYYKGSEYSVNQYELGTVPYAGIHFMTDYYYRKATYTVGDSNIMNGYYPVLIAGGSHVYAYPSVKSAIGKDDYADDLSNNTKKEHNDEDYVTASNSVDYLFDSKEEASAIFDDAEIKWTEKSCNNSISIYMTTDGSNNTSYCGYLDNMSNYYVGIQRAYNRKIYVIPGIKDVVPNYRNYGIYNGYNGSGTLTLSAYSYANSITLHDTLNGTVTTCSDINNLPKFTYNDDKTKILIGWSLKEDSNVLYVPNITKPIKNIDLYSVWSTVSEELGNYKLNDPTYKLVDDFSTNDRFYANDILLIGSKETNAFQKVFFGAENTTAEIKLKTNDDTLNSVFGEYMKGAEAIKGLEEVNSAVIFNSNGTGSKVYMTSASSKEDKIKVGNHKVIISGQNVYFDQNGKIALGELVNDNNNLRVLSNGSLFTVDKIFLGYTTIDMLKMDNISNSYTGYFFVNESNELEEIFFDEESDAYTDVSGNVLSDGTRCYKEGEIYFVDYDIDNKGYKLNTTAWDDTINLDLVLTGADGNKFLTACGAVMTDGSGYYSNALYDVTAYQNAYTQFLERYLLGAVDKSYFIEAYLVNSLASGKDVTDVLQAKSYELIMFPREEELKKHNMFVEEYCVDNVSSTLWGKYTINMVPNKYNLDVYSETAYEYMTTDISAEALRTPELSEWHVKYDQNAADVPTVLNFFTNDDVSSDYNKRTSDNMYNLVKPRIYQDAEQVINFTTEAYSIVDSNALNDFKIYKRDYNGNLTDITGKAGVIVNEKTPEYAPFNGEHVKKVVNTYGLDSSSDSSFMVLTEEGHLWLSGSVNTAGYSAFGAEAGTNYNSQPKSYFNADSFNSDTRSFIQVGGNTKFKDFYFNYMTLVAIDEDGNFWSNYAYTGDYNSTLSFGLHQVSDGIEFTKIGVVNYYDPQIISLLDKDGNIWVFTPRNTRSLDSGVLSIFHGKLQYGVEDYLQYQPVEDYYGASSSYIKGSSVLMKLTEGTRFVDVGIDSYSSEGIVAIDEDGKMWIGGYIDNLPGYYINGVPSFSNYDWKNPYIPYLKQLTDIYPGVYDNIKWASIEDRRYETSEMYTNGFGFIDSENNLWECFDSNFGYEVTETNVLDGAGKYVLDTDGKLHVRDKSEKAECLRTDNIILDDYTFKEVGSAVFQYFLTEDDAYMFSDATGGGSVQLLEYYGCENWFYIDFYAPVVSYVYKDSYNGTTVNDKYGNNTGIKGIFCNNAPGVDINTFSFEKGQPAGYTTSYDISIDLEMLESVGKVKIVNGDSFVVLANPSDDTLYRITDAESISYDIVDSYITNENVTSNEIKSNTPITMNTLTLAPVTMSMDKSIYYLKSNYENDETDYYSDVISLDVVALESLKADYIGNDKIVGTYANTDDVVLTLKYEDGHEIEISWDDLTDAPDNLFIENVGPNTYEVEFEGKKDTFTINGKNGIVSLTADYPESVFVGTEFDPDKVTVTAIYSDGSTITPDMDWSDVDKVIKQIGDNKYVINYDDASANLIIQGYYYDKLKAEYTGNPVKIYESYDKEDVTVTVTYTENNLGKTEDVLTSDEWQEDSLVVSAVGENIFTATLIADPKFSDTYYVEGLDYFTSLRATYTGEDILTGNDYDKNDVIVEGINKSDGNGVVIPTYKWTESGLTVNVNGENLFTASYNGLTADYYVNGYSEGLQATYVGNDILVGKTYDKDDVEVYVVDSKGNRNRINTEDWIEDSLIVSLEGNNKFTATYNGMQDTFIVNGYQISGLTAIYTGNAIPVGEEYEKIDVVVIVKYSNGTERQLEPDEWNESGLVVTNVGDNDFTASYNGYEADYVVPGVGIIAIKANYNGGDIYVGNSYNKEDVEVIAVYSDGSETILDTNRWTESGLKVKSIGNNDYIATYNGLEDNYIVPGYDIKGITAKYHGKDILVGEKYDKKDVVVVVEYTNGTKRTLEPNDWKENSLIVEKDGDNTYKADYNGFNAEYTVLGYQSIGISAVYRGEPIKIGSDYEKADVLVKLLFSNDTEKILNTNDWTESSLTVTKDGENDYTATYDTFTADYQVLGYMITEPKVIKIEGRYPEDVLVGDEYEESKVIITVTYDNGETSELDYNKLDEKPDDTTVKQIGDNHYPIAYKGVIGTLIVTGYDVDKIIAEYHGPDIIVGKDYSKDDVIVTVYYTNGKTDQITDFSVDSVTVTKVGENNYIATYKGKTAQYIVRGIIETVDVIDAKSEKTLSNFIISAKTGDSSPVVLCLILIIIGISSMVLLFAYKHKKHGR